MQSAANYIGAVIEAGAPAMGSVTVSQAGPYYQLQWSHPVNSAQQFSSSFAGYTYDIEMNNGMGGNNYVVLESTNTNSYLVDNINPSLNYRFRVRARNNCGYGAYSDDAIAQGVIPPGKLDRPTITLVGCNVIFSWGEVQNTGGSPVTTN
jgi:hypothetical protein